MTNQAVTTVAQRRAGLLPWIPAAALLLVALVAAAGISLIPPAGAASVSNVTVTATLGSAVTIGDSTCGSGVSPNRTVAFGAITLGGFTPSAVTCPLTFGSTNAASTLQLKSSTAANFFQGGPGTISDKTGTACGAIALAADTGAIAIVGATATIPTGAGDWGNDASCTTAGTNDNTTTPKWRGVPPLASPVNVCANVSGNTTNGCTFSWAIAENGSNLAPGSYAGTAIFTVS